jgi:Jacalin-like lectin domain
MGGTGGSARQFNLAPNEHIARVEVRSGAWLDAIEIVLSSGRTSGWHGGNGGGRRTLAPAHGQTIVGFYGSHQQWLHSLGLVLA